MKARENRWALVDGNGNTIKTMVQADQPENEDETGWTSWVPVYAKSRITGSSYLPYSGSSEWVHAANAAMADEANYNFRAAE